MTAFCVVFFVVFIFEEPNIVNSLSKSGEERFLNKFTKRLMDFKNLVVWLLSAQSHTWPTGLGFFSTPNIWSYLPVASAWEAQGY